MTVHRCCGDAYTDVCCCVVLCNREAVWTLLLSLCHVYSWHSVIRMYLNCRLGRCLTTRKPILLFFTSFAAIQLYTLSVFL